MPESESSCSRKLLRAFRASVRYPDFRGFLEREGRQVASALVEQSSPVPDLAVDRGFYYDWGASEMFSLAGRGPGECSAGVFDLIEVDLENARDAMSRGQYFEAAVLASRSLLVTRGQQAQNAIESLNLLTRTRAELVRDLAFSTTRLENLKTAVAEAAMNAMEHGNHYQPELPVLIQVYKSESTIWIYVTDQGGGRPIPTPNTPDLEAKLAGLQSPRGWGLFLIKNLVDEMHVLSDAKHHTIELVMSLQGGPHGNQPA